MNLYKQYNKIREESEKTKKERVKNHKCNNCNWGKYAGTSYVCLLPACLKGLGNFKR